MGTQRDVTWWEAPCRWDWFIPSICSAAVPTDPVQPARSPCRPSTHSDPNVLESSAYPQNRTHPHQGAVTLYAKHSLSHFTDIRLNFACRCELIMQWVIPHAVSIRRFLLTFWPWVIAVRTTRHFCLNPQITSRFIWTASFRCLTEYSE